MSILALKGGNAVAEPLKQVKWPRLYPEDEAAVLDALRQGYWGGIGDDNLPNRKFERAFAEYHNATYGTVVANGTVALELSLKTGGIRPGDEVIVPAITFIASASAIICVGAVPVFVDVDPDSCQISATAIAAAITPKTRAIIAVHFGGYMADMDAILEVADRHGLFVIEDCAHAQGAAWRNKRAGSRGTFGSFSFQESKSLSSGEGGIVLTNNEELYEKAQLIRNIGRKTGQRVYNHLMPATNWRLGGLQAALLLSQFGKLPAEAEERHRNALILADALNQIEGLRSLPIDERLTQWGCYFFILEFDAAAFGCSRDHFVQAMRAEGVTWTTRGYDRPLYKEAAFTAEALRPLLHESIPLPDYAGMQLPNAERWAVNMVTILHYYLLGDRSGVDYIIEAIHKIKKNVAELRDVVL